MSAIYKEPLSVLKRLLFVAMVVLGMTIATSTVDAANKITGTVYNDVDNQANSFDTAAGDYAVRSGFVVGLYDAAGANEIKVGGVHITGTTDGNGDYVLQAPNGGSFTVKVKSVPGASGYNLISGHFNSIILNGTLDYPGINLSVRGNGGSISGKVGTQDSVSMLGNIQITLNGTIQGGGTITSTTTTLPNGTYVFSNIPTGTYTLTPNLQDIENQNFTYFNATGGGAVPIFSLSVAMVGSPVAGRDFYVIAPNTTGITGYLYSDLSGTATGVGLPIPNETVALYYSDGTTLVKKVDGVTNVEATTNSSGFYQFSSLAPRDYVVKLKTMPTGFGISGSKDGIGLDKINISLSTNANTQNNFYIKVTGATPGYATIRGNTFASNGTYVRTANLGTTADGISKLKATSIPVSYAAAKFQGMEIKLYIDDSSVWKEVAKLSTGTDGDYKFAGLPAGKYKVALTPNATITGSYQFINDADGKFGTEQPYEIVTAVSGGDTKTEQNFWYGLPVQNATARAPILFRAGSYGMGGNLGGYYVIGPKLAFYEEDGVTPVGSPQLKVTLNTLDNSIPANTILPGLYVVKAESGTGLGTDYKIPDQWVTITNNSRSYALAVGNLNSAFKMYDSTSITASQIVAQIYVDIDNTDGTNYVDGTDIPLHPSLITLYPQSTLVNILGTNTSGQNQTQTTTGLAKWENLIKGKYSLNVSALQPEYAELVEIESVYDGVNWITNPTFPITIDATAGPVQNIQIRYKKKIPGHYVTGRAWIDIDDNGVPTLPTPGDAHTVADLPLSGVTVQLLDSSKNPIVGKTATTDAKGWYTFDSLVAGTYYVRVTAPTGYTLYVTPNDVKQEFSGTPGVYGETSFVFAGNTNSNPAAGKGSTAAKNSGVSGVHFTDLNGNDVVDSGEKVGAGYPRLWMKNPSTNKYDSDHVVSFRAKSDYDFYNLGPGDYKITSGDGTGYGRVIRKDSDPGSPVAEIHFTITGSETTGLTDKNFWFGILADSGISGAMYLDFRGDGVLDTNGMKYAPAGTKAEWYDLAGAGGATTKVGDVTFTAAGDYSFDKAGGFNVYAGSHYIKIPSVPAGYQVVNDQDGLNKPTGVLPDPGTILAGFYTTGGLGGQNFLIKRTTNVEFSGYLFVDGDYDGQYDADNKSPDDSAIGDATLKIYDSGNNLLGTVKTDSKGFYAVHNLPDGNNYKIEIDASTVNSSLNIKNNSKGTASTSMTFNISGSKQQNQNFWFNDKTDAGVAGLVVVDLDNDGVANIKPDKTGDMSAGVGITVYLHRAGTTDKFKTTTTNAGGSFKFVPVPAGTYDIEILTSSIPSGYSLYGNSKGQVGLGATKITGVALSGNMATDQNFLLAGNSNNSPQLGPNNHTNSGVKGKTTKLSQGGAALGGVVLSLTEISTGKEIARTTSDASGNYQFLNLKNANYKVSVFSSPSGYAAIGDVDTATYPNPGELQAAIVTNGVNGRDIWFGQTSTVGIQGTVSYTNSTISPGSPTNQKIVGVEVELYFSTNTTQVYQSTVTDANGAYKFENIPTLSYIVKIKDQELTDHGFNILMPNTPGSYTINNLAQAGVTDKHFIINGKYALSGKIGVDTNTDNTPDNFPTVFQNLDTKITWLGLDGDVDGGDDIIFKSGTATTEIQVNTGKTNATGDYSYANLPVGKYKIEYNGTGFTGYQLINDPDGIKDGPPSDITITNASVTNAHFVYEALGSIFGQVFFDADGSNSKTATDVGMNGVTVNLYAWDSGTSAFKATPLKTTTTATSGANVGAYEFTGISLGRYKVEAVSATGYSVAYVTKGTATGYIDESLTSSNGTAWDIGLKGSNPALATVTLKTRNDSNNNKKYETTDGALPAIQVEVATATGISPSFKYTVTTDANGNYNLKNLPEVNLTFTVKSTMTAYDRAYNSTANTGVAPTTDSFTMKLDAAAITAGHPFFGYRLKQTGTRTVSGAVVIDTNNNGSYDNPTATPPDSPMTGAKVTLKTSGGLVVDSVTIPATGTSTGLGGYASANANGTFSFGTTLNNDTYAIEITNVPANYISKFPAGTTVTGTGLTAVYKMPASNATAGNSTNNYQGFVGDTAGNKARNVTVYTRNDNGNKTYDAAIATDTALNGATVKLTSATTNYSNTITTVSGAATFTNVPFATDYKVEVTTSTNMLHVYNNNGGNLNITTNPVNITNFNVKASAGTDVADIPYFGFLPNTSGTSKLTGRVVFDADNDGVADTGEGINGLIVTLYVKTGGSYVKVTTPGSFTTANDGNFTFDNIANGTYRVQVDVAGTPESNQAKLNGYQTKFGLATLYATTDVTVSGATTHNFGYVGDPATGKARNVDTYVRFDTNMNTAYDSNTTVDFPANGYKVTLASASRGITVSGTTAGTGKYTFTALPYATDYTATISNLGTKTVVYNNTGASTSTSVSSFKVENLVTVGTQEVQDKANIPYFGLKEGTPPSGAGEIKGSVRLDSNGNNAYDGTDPLLGGVTLALSYDVGSGNYAPLTTHASANGEFTFGLLDPAKTYRVQVIAGIPAGYTVVYDKGIAGTNNYTTGTPGTGWHFGYKAGGPNVKTTVEIGTYQTTAAAVAWSAADISLSGINLSLSGTSTDGNTISGALTSGTGGKITLQNFPYGVYTLSNGTNSGYVLKYSVTGLTVNATSPASEPKWGYAVNTSGNKKISGTVKFDVNDDGTADSAIAGLKLVLYSYNTATTSWVDTGLSPQITDGNGAFKFENIADNKKYRVVVETTSRSMIDGYKGKNDIAGTAVITTQAIYESVDVSLAGTDKTLDMIYAADMTQPTKNRAVTIETRSDRNSDKKYQSTDDPIKDVIISVVSASKGINITGATYLTDVNGKIVFNLPFATDYKITATKSGLTAVYDNQHNTGTGGSTGVLTNFAVATTTGQAINDIPFFGFFGTTIPSGTGTVKGYVVNDKTGTTANSWDSQDTGLGNVVVGLSYKDASGNWISAGTMTTNNTGLYSKASLDSSLTWRVEILSGIPANHTLAFNPSGPSTTNPFHSGTITATPGTEWNFGYTPGAGAKVKDIVLYTYNDSAGTTSGSKDSGDTPLSGIEIRISGTSDDGNSINQVYTSGSTGNPAGQVKLDGFPQGTYTITSEATNDSSYTFMYSSGGTKSFSVTVSNALPVAGEPFFGYAPQAPVGTLKIEGTIKYQTQSFGTPHASDSPLTGVVVALLYETGNGTNTYNLVKRLSPTSANGQYSFGNLGASQNNRRYKVIVESGLPAGALDSYTEVNSVVGTGAKDILGTLSATNHIWNFGFKGSGNPADSHSMKLESYYDTNGTGKYEVIDASTKQNGIIIEVVGATYLTTPQSYTLTTGTYTLTNLPNDTYTITSKNHGTLGMKVIYNKADNQATAGTSANYSSYTANVNNTYNSANPEYFGYFADVSGTTKIAGRVVIDSDNNSQYTTPSAGNINDIGVNNVTVSLYSVTSGVPSFLASKTTASDGSYEFTGYASNKTYRVVVADTVAPLNAYTSVFTKVTGAAGSSIEENVNTDVNNWNFGYQAKTGQNGTLKLLTRWDNGNKNYDAVTTTDKVRGAVAVTITGGALSNQVVTTDASGEITLYNLATGSYSFTVASEPNIAVVYNAAGNNQTGLISSKILANGTNEVAIGYLLDVYKPGNTGEIKGRVVIDSNASAGVDAADFGLKNVKLKLEYKNGGVWQEIPTIPATVLTTNANGEFTINQLKEGAAMEYRLSVVASTIPAGLTIKYVGPSDANSSTAEYSGILNGGTTGSNWNFGYIASDNGSLTVNTRLDTDFSGDKTNTATTIDPFLTGIEIRVTGLGGVLDVTFTSDGTSKVINNLPYGAYTIATNLAGTTTGQKMEVAYDPNGTTNSTVTFTSSTISSAADYGFKVKTDPVTGRKVEGKTVTDTDTNYANGASPYNGMTVKISVQDGANWLQVLPTQLTATAGDFKFENLVSGWTYKVEVVNPTMTLKYVKAGTAATENTATTQSEIVKAVSTNETGWIFAYGGSHTLEGVVTFDTDRSQTYRPTVDIPIPGAIVEATATIGGNLQSFTMTTGANGRYSFPSLMAGQWTVTVTGFDATHVGSNYLESYAMTTKNVKTYTENVGPSMSTADRNFGFYGDAEIHGKVIIDLNGDNQFQTVEATKVLAGFVGYLKVMPDPTQAGASDFVPFYVKVKPTGDYKIEHLVPGFNYIFEAYPGAPPTGAQVFALPANYLNLSYFAADNGGGTIVTRTMVTPQGVARTMPVMTTPQYTLATTYVAFRSTYVIDGKVMLDTNGNGINDANDTPLAGVTVQAYNPSLDSPLGTLPAITTITDATGSYSFAGLTGLLGGGDGKWEISVTTGLPTGVAISYETSSIESPTNLDGIQTVLLDSNKANVNFGYKGSSSITGTIQKVIGTADLPFGGVTVELYDKNSNLISSTQSIANGTFTFSNLADYDPAKDYQLRINMGQAALTAYDHVSGFFGTAPIFTYDVNFANNSDVIILTVADFFKVKPRANYAIGGYVFHDANDNGAYEATETVPTGAQIEIFDSANNSVGLVNPIPANGQYSFANLPAGQYRLVVTGVPAQYAASFDPDNAYSVSQVITVNPGEATINLTGPKSDYNFGYIFGGTVTTVVKNNQGGAYNAADPGLANAEVELRTAVAAGTEIQTKKTDSQGLVTFRNLDPTVTYYVAVPFGTPNNSNPMSPLQQVQYVDHGSTKVGTIPAAADMNGDSVTEVNMAVLGPNVLSTDVYFGFQFNTYKVTVTKVALKDTVHVGEFVPYKVTITSNESKPIPGMILKDLIPAGFKYVKGSARITDAAGNRTAIEPTGQRPIEFTIGTMNQGDKITLNYILVAGSGVTPGNYVNKANTVTLAGFQNSNVASATVKVTGDPLFDDSLIFGKVFHDKNRNGRQDKDEPGVGGVKLVTARGGIITTDENGRYHLADVSGGRWERGTNFILKLDTRSLPQGLTTTTENPIVVRLSPGLPSRINFGVEVPPPVAARLAEQLALAKVEEVKKIEEKLQKEEKFVVESIHFAFDQDRIEPEFENTLDSLAEVLRLHPEWKIRIEGHTDSLGTEAYNKDLSQRRANSVKAYLLKTGVNPTQLVDAVGLGLGEPIADNGTPEGRYKNRRVEFKLEK